MREAGSIRRAVVNVLLAVVLAFLLVVYVAIRRSRYIPPAYKRTVTLGKDERRRLHNKFFERTVSLAQRIKREETFTETIPVEEVNGYLQYEGREAVEWLPADIGIPQVHTEDGHFVLSGGMDGRQLAFDAKTGQRLPSLYVVREVPFQTRSFLLREEEDVGPTPEGTTTPAAAREGGAQRGAPVQQGSAAGRASASSRPRMATFTAPAFVPPTRLVPNLAHASRPGTSYSTLGSVDRSVSGRIGYGGSR